MTFSVPRPLKPCAQAGCAGNAIKSSSYCIEHKPKQAEDHNEKRRGTYHRAEWREARRRALQMQRSCQLEHLLGCRGILHVHHENGVATDNRIENLVVLCSRHHMKLEMEKGTGELTRAVRAIQERRWA